MVARLGVLEDEVREARDRLERLQVLGERALVREDDLLPVREPRRDRVVRPRRGRGRGRPAGLGPFERRRAALVLVEVPARGRRGLSPRARGPSTGGNFASNRVLTASPISFFATISAPCCSPSNTISTLPVIAGSAAKRSHEARRDDALARLQRRAARGSRPGSRAPRSARRADTPEDWSTSSLLRAWNAISSTRSLTASPRSTVTPRGVAVGPGLLVRDRGGDLRVVRVVREDLRGDAVPQRRDDVAAVRVVLGVRREHDQDVERDADREAADLEVALLEDVEEADLDARLQVRQLVDREDAAVRARDDAVVDDVLVRERQLERRGLDRIDVADEVGDRDVRRRELLAVAVLARKPGDGQVVVPPWRPCGGRGVNGANGTR